MSPKSGAFIEEELEYDGGRQVAAYVPPGAKPEAIVFCVDGQLIPKWGVDLEASELPPIMIVGLFRAHDEHRRLHEYSPIFDPVRFAAHEAFFVNEVFCWAKSRSGVALPASKTAVFGVSAGGEFALAMGVRHPDLFGQIFCASPGGGYRPPTPLPKNVPRAYFVAGSQEPFFLQNAERWANAIREIGTEAILNVRDGVHGDPFWREEFRLMVEWAFHRR